MLASADLIRRVIHQESRGNPLAVSPAGAQGLMQVMPATARDPGFGIQPLSDPFNPDENRRFGTQYLNAMLRRYDGDEARALVAYNWGVGNADKWSGDPRDLPEETRGYLRSILRGQERPAQPPNPLSRRDDRQNSLAPVRAAPQRPQAPQINPISYQFRLA